jgi:hypothetical protein
MRAQVTKAMAKRAVEAALYLFRDTNILSIGVGHKRTARKKSSRMAVVFTVYRKVVNRKLIAEGYTIPKRLRVPAKGKAVAFAIATDVVQQRRKSFSTTTSPVGSKIQPEGSLSFGTFGAAVCDQDNRLFILSGSHVFTDYGRRAQIGQRIMDAASGREIAVLFRYFELLPGYPNYADVGLAELTAGDVIERIRANPDLKGIGTTEMGASVRVVGASSGSNSGEVSRLSVTERVFGWGGDPNASCIMSDQIEIEHLGVNGDSGAVVRDSDNKAVGLFIADNGRFDLMTDIRRVLLFASQPGTMICGPGDNRVLQLKPM